MPRAPRWRNSLFLSGSLSLWQFATRNHEPHKDYAGDHAERDGVLESRMELSRHRPRFVLALGTVLPVHAMRLFDREPQFLQGVNDGNPQYGPASEDSDNDCQ